MEMLAIVPAVLLIFIVLLDAFETVVLPRRVNRRLRLARLFYRSTWIPWSRLAQRLPGNRREDYLSFYGPLSLILLLGLWAALLILGFGLLHWGLGSHFADAHRGSGFASDIYVSGTTFFTLGLGDVTPTSSLARSITVIEGGAGFGFLALVITYLPVLYQSFSRRETQVSLLDSRAGSPPSAVTLLVRLDRDRNSEALEQLLRDWERWAAEVLESHLSYPVLALYRSQHERESWLAALTAILDVCALIGASAQGEFRATAQLTFAMARHAAVDLGQIFGAAPSVQQADRLPRQDFERMSAILTGSGCRSGQVDYEKLAELRAMYEPYVGALSNYLLMPLPPWLPEEHPDDWQSSPWE
jgi:hypothetical protein